MASEIKPSMTWEAAEALLGVEAGAGEAAVRAAYLENVRLHPPDREPEAFERVRDAYAQLRDPRAKAQQILAGPDPMAPLTSMLDGLSKRRRFLGPAMWMTVLKEKRT